jgi:hypothetical protein
MKATIFLTQIILLLGVSLSAGAQINGLDESMSRKARNREESPSRREMHRLVIVNTTSDTLFYEIQRLQSDINTSIDQQLPYMGHLESPQKRLMPNETENDEFISDGFNLVIYKYDATGQKVIIKQATSRVRYGRHVVRI